MVGKCLTIVPIAFQSTRMRLDSVTLRASGPRHYIELELGVDLQLDLPQAIAHHVSRVTRMRVGDFVTLFNGNGLEYSAQILNMSNKSVQVNIFALHTPKVESPISIVLLQCLSAGDNMAYTIEKSVELGVTAIVPIQAERSVVQLSGDRADKKREHWANIAKASAAQSGRTRVPIVHPIQDIKHCCGWMQENYPAHHLLVIQPQAPVRLTEELISLKKNGGHSVALVVGPEGGFAASELSLLESGGFTAASLGPRIMRTETAGPTAIAIAQALCGDF